MVDITEIVPVDLKVANGQTIISKKQGRSIVYCNHGNNNVKQTTNEALIVETLPYNFHYVPKIKKAEFWVIFYECRAHIMQKNNVLFTSSTYSNLFIVIFPLFEDKLMQVCQVYLKKTFGIFD